MNSREGNFELMRIILFLMVVAIHVSSPYLSNHTVVGVVNWQIANILDGGSRVAVDCFVLITGYFVGASRDPRPGKLIAKVIEPIPFYMLLYLPLYYLDNKGNLCLSLCSALQDLVGNTIYLYHLWYVQVLIAIYLLSPYLNVLIHQLSPLKLRGLIATLYCIGSVIPSLVYMFGIDFYDLSLLNSRLLLFVTLYLIGAYIRKYSQVDTPPQRLFGLFFMADASIVVLSCLYNSRWSPLIALAHLRGAGLTYPLRGLTGVFYEFNNFLVIGASILLMLAFARLKISSRLINYVSRWSYGAYLGHVLWINVLSRIVNPFGAAFDSPHYPSIVLVFILSVSVCSLVTEAIRQMVLGVVRNWVLESRGRH